MDNIHNLINIPRYTKLANKFLAITHFIVAIFYLVQQAIIIRNSLLIDDEIIKKIVVNTMTYISIGISIILILINAFAGIGILSWKSWSWRLSVSFFLYLAIQKILSFLLGLYTRFFLIGIDGDTLSLSEFDSILNSLYISAIAIIVLLFLNETQVYINYKKNIVSKKGNFFICLGVAIVFIFINILLYEIGNFLS